MNRRVAPYNLGQFETIEAKAFAAAALIYAVSSW